MFAAAARQEYLPVLGTVQRRTGVATAHQSAVQTGARGAEIVVESLPRSVELPLQQALAVGWFDQTTETCYTDKRALPLHIRLFCSQAQVCSITNV